MTITIQQAINKWLGSVGAARSHNTYKTYRRAARFFSHTLKKRRTPISKTPVSKLDHRAIVGLCDDLKRLAPASERLYLQAILKFYKYLAAEEMANVNIEKVRLQIEMHSRRAGERMIQFDLKAVETLLERIEDLKPAAKNPQRLIDLRDKAFLLTLPATGARVSEAIGLKRGDINWKKKQAVIIGKGNKQAAIIFDDLSLKAIKTYLDTRAPLDGNTGVPLLSLPLFARHDPGSGKKVNAISITTGENIVKRRVRQLLSDEETARITPHVFRHYFVTLFYRATKDLKQAAEQARHSNIQTTSRYAHLEDSEKVDLHSRVMENRRKRK